MRRSGGEKKDDRLEEEICCGVSCVSLVDLGARKKVNQVNRVHVPSSMSLSLSSFRIIYGRFKLTTIKVYYRHSSHFRPADATPPILLLLFQLHFFRSVSLQSGCCCSYFWLSSEKRKHTLGVSDRHFSVRPLMDYDECWASRDVYSSHLTSFLSLIFLQGDRAEDEEEAVAANEQQQNRRA